MTPQEIFDTVWHAMKAQGEQSVNDEGDCMYRGENGTKCAVGCLISDEQYTPDMDDIWSSGTSVKSLWVRELLPAELVPHVDLLKDLQDAHDNAIGNFWSGFTAHAKSVAVEHNLTIPENNQ